MENDFEEWQGDYDLIQEEDWTGLVLLRKRKAEKNPNDLQSQWRYGEALVYNQEFQMALNLLTAIYKKEPEYYDVIHSILDSLYGLGKTEDDFEWVETPIVLKLDDQTKEMCEEVLKNKRKPISYYQLIEPFIIKSHYITFKGEKLFDYLKKDGRFKFSNEEYFSDVKVELVKGK